MGLMQLKEGVLLSCQYRTVLDCYPFSKAREKQREFNIKDKSEQQRLLCLFLAGGSLQAPSCHARAYTYNITLHILNH